MPELQQCNKTVQNIMRCTYAGPILSHFTFRLEQVAHVKDIAVWSLSEGGVRLSPLFSAGAMGTGAIRTLDAAMVCCYFPLSRVSKKEKARLRSESKSDCEDSSCTMQATQTCSGKCRPVSNKLELQDKLPCMLHS